jgi:hypothetical protein|tara:strand:+ start:6218 stop:6763 length:546 start_codon:yes stop_codon:yes gene_type:complete
MRLPTLPRYIPEGFKVLKETPLAVVYGDRENLKAIAYKGKSKKPIWYYRFQKPENLDKKINELFERLENWEDMKKQRRIERKKNVLDIKVGDILYSSWGYDQTNIDFYQVIEKKGSTFVIREISQKGSNYMSHGMACDVQPVRDSFIGDPIIRRSLGGGNSSWKHLSKTTDEAKHYKSWYA